MNFLEALPYEWVLILFLHNADPALDERMVGAIESCELPVVEKAIDKYVFDTRMNRDEIYGWGCYNKKIFLQRRKARRGMGFY